MELLLDRRQHQHATQLTAQHTDISLYSLTFHPDPMARPAWKSFFQSCPFFSLGATLKLCNFGHVTQLATNDE